MANRRRNKNIKIRLTDSEYAQLLSRLEESGRESIQQYGLDALLNSEITSPELLQAVRTINDRFADLQRIERGIGTNINQIAHQCNSNGYASPVELNRVLVEYQLANEERRSTWQLIRSLLTMLSHMKE